MVLNTFAHIHKYSFMLLSRNIHPHVTFLARPRHANVPVQIVSLICMAAAPRERRTLSRVIRSSSSFFLAPRLRRQSRKRGSNRWSRVMKRFSACTSGGRPHVAYVYFLQLTLRDSSRATRPSLTTAVFTTMTTTATTKRTSAVVLIVVSRRTARAWARKCAWLARMNKN